MAGPALNNATAVYAEQIESNRGPGHHSARTIGPTAAGG